jgi:DNA uptake protein ComE-like DNA-binding protein
MFFNKYPKFYLIYFVLAPRMKSHIKNYLSITKKEWNGMVVLVILIALILVAPYTYQFWHKDSIINFKDFNAAVAVLGKAKKSQAADYPDNPGEKSSNASIFYKKAIPGVVIELNSANSAKLTELRGIGPSLAMGIIRYRIRLGGFYHKEQLKEVFGLDSVAYAGLQSQVRVDPSHIKKNTCKQHYF